MNRTVNLLACLAILVGGVALEAPADDANSAAASKPCCGAGQKTMGKNVAFVNNGEDFTSVCLQYLIYEDETDALWVADAYEALDCHDTPFECFAWADPGEQGPQSCGGDPGCIAVLGLRSGDPLVKSRINQSPALRNPLASGKSYVDLPLRPVQIPGQPAGKTWHPSAGLQDLGELKTTFVKVRNAAGKYFAVRLAAGIAEFEKTKPQVPFSPRPKILNRKILVGFEVEMDQADIDELAEVSPTNWPLYKDCPTAFMVSVGGANYHVTITKANAIK